MQRKNLKCIQGVDFELTEYLPNNGTNYLLIFDDSFEEVSNCNSLVQVIEECFTKQNNKSKLDLGSQLSEWYQDATSNAYGHLLIDLTPKTVDSL